MKIGTLPGTGLVLDFGLFQWPMFNDRDLAIDNEYLDKHWHLIGASGTGKSYLLSALYGFLLKQGRAVTLIEPTGQGTDDVLKRLIAQGYFKRADIDPYKKLIWVDLGVRDHRFPLNPLIVPWADQSRIANMMVEACHRVWPVLAPGAANFDRTMKACVRLLLFAGLELTALSELLINGKWRASLYPRIPPELYTIRSFFEHELDEMTAYGAQQNINSTSNRAFQFANEPELQEIIGQPANNLNVRQIIDSGTNVLISLGGLPRDVKAFYGALITHQYEEAAMSRNPSDNLPAHTLIADEFGLFSAQSAEAFSHVLDECRKYGLFTMLSHQNWAQTNPKLAGALGNVGVRVTFRVGPEDADIQAKVMGSFDLQAVKAVSDKGYTSYASAQDQHKAWAEQLMNQPNRIATVRVGTSPSVEIKTLDMPAPNVSDAELQAVKDEYFKRYYTPRDQVLPPFSNGNPAPTQRGKRND